MSLTISRDRIKERCMISVSDYDSLIDNLIADLEPMIEFAIRDEYLLDSDAGLQAMLSYGALQIGTGEFMKCLLRKVGFAESIGYGVAVPMIGTQRAEEAQAGWMTLKPFLKNSFSNSSEPKIQFAPKPEP
jgi:hypothetical protein